MGAGRLMQNPTQRGDASSVSTQSTQESSISPQLYGNRLHRLHVNTKSNQKRSPRTSQLFLPHLDNDVKSSCWPCKPSKFTATMYMIVAVALVLRNHRVLFATCLGFLFHMIEVIMKWGSFVVQDLRPRVARSCSTRRPYAQFGFLLCLIFSAMVEHETTPRRERCDTTA